MAMIPHVRTRFSIEPGEVTRHRRSRRVRV